MRGAWLAAVLLAALPAGAEEADDAARDEAIFGGSEGSTEEAARDEAIFGESEGSTEEAARDDEIFGGSEGSTVVPAAARGGGEGLLSSGEIDRRLDLAGDKLAIGGLLYLRGEYTGAEGTLVERDPITSPNLLDVYFDARPSDRLRAFARGRLTHSFAGGDAATGDTGIGGTRQDGAALDQLWVKFDVEERLFVTAGRQPIRWGASRVWNPTDFLNDRVRDPLAFFDERLGVSLVKLHLPVEASGWNLYAIADLEEASTVEGLGGAFRIEKLIGSTEISLSTALQKEKPWRIGADVSFPLWDFDVRGELALRHDDRQAYYRGDFDLAPVAELQRPTLPARWDRSDEWIPQAVLGADIALRYSDEDNVVLGAEYFFNGAGTGNEALYPWLLANGFSPLYLGRNYGALFASLAGPGSWNDTSITGTVLGNLDDRSFIGRLNYAVRLLTYLDLNLSAQYHFGSTGEFRLATRVPGIAGYDAMNDEERQMVDAALAEAGVPPPLADALRSGGIDRPAPRIALGAGLQLRF